MCTLALTLKFVYSRRVTAARVTAARVTAAGVTAVMKMNGAVHLHHAVGHAEHAARNHVGGELAAERVEGRGLLQLQRKEPLARTPQRWRHSARPSLERRSPVSAHEAQFGARVGERMERGWREDGERMERG